MAGRWGWGLGMKITCVWTRWQCHCLHLCEVLCANEIHNSNESYSLLHIYIPTVHCFTYCMYYICMMYIVYIVYYSTRTTLNQLLIMLFKPLQSFFQALQQCILVCVSLSRGLYVFLLVIGRLQVYFYGS